MKKRVTVVILVGFLVILSAIFIPRVQTNYDMTQYLPIDSNTKIGLDILENEFGNESSVEILINDISVANVLAIKAEILNVNLVSSVIWLDDYVDLNVVPIEFIDPSVVSPFYQDSDALLIVNFTGDSYQLELTESMEDVEDIVKNYVVQYRGDLLMNREARTIASGEVTKILFLIIPVIIIILLFASKTWIEPIIILVSLGIGVALNSGTNALLPDVSFITLTMALALQLALSLDYSLFLIHRFYEEKEKEADPIKASKLALKHAFPSITASAFTTIAGFSALFLMDYRIGSDIALVLSKGILFSYLTAVIVLPIFLIWCDKLITKTKHRVFLPSFKKYSIALYKLRFILVPILVIISILGFIYQQKTEYVYGSGSLADETTTLYTDNQIISERFGSRNLSIILVPNETVLQEVNLVNHLLSLENIESVQALVTSADPNIPREFLPAELVSQFVGESYSRIIINTTIDGENAEMYRLNAEIRETVGLYYDDFYTVGMASSVSDIKDSVLADSAMVVIFSCLAVGFIIMLIFKSISIPVLLVMIIQSSVWLNISLLFAQGIQTQYIGYLVVMSIQLGATIDYAVLLTNRYMDFRKTMNPHDSILEAFQKSSTSIIISAVVLSVAGFVEGFFSDILSVTEIGLLLGKGALISGLLIFIFLPPSLVLFDKLIMKTTLHPKGIEKTRN
ncbi:MAG: hypothetical protein A2013_03425 [Tenericutes bacterium GWE2_38_8]|nr:MAG: hypothetical protein A2013_03425 [Tenericutes bacterium GWE2_38_8]